LIFFWCLGDQIDSSNNEIVKRSALKESDGIVSFQFLRRLNKTTISKQIKIPSLLSLFTDIIYMLFPDEFPFINLPPNNSGSFLFYFSTHDKYLDSVVPSHMSVHWFNGIARNHGQTEGLCNNNNLDNNIKDNNEKIP
jgi:hypothetical protein